MSTIYNSLYAELDPKRYGDTSGPNTLKMEVGTSFEEVLEPVLAQRLLGKRPGEFTTPEGIIYSPDYIFPGPPLVLGEFKLTWYSSKDAPTDAKFDKWMTQIKAYCYCLGTPLARLYVLFVNGDYKPPSPQLLAWDVQFTARELEDNYEMLLRHARRKGMLP